MLELTVIGSALLILYIYAVYIVQTTNKKWANVVIKIITIIVITAMVVFLITDAYLNPRLF